MNKYNSFRSLLVCMTICVSTFAMAQQLVNDSKLIYGKINSDEWTGNPLTEGCNNKGSIVYRVMEKAHKEKDLDTKNLLN